MEGSYCAGAPAQSARWRYGPPGSGLPPLAIPNARRKRLGQNRRAWLRRRGSGEAISGTGRALVVAPVMPTEVWNNTRAAFIRDAHPSTASVTGRSSHLIWLKVREPPGTHPEVDGRMIPCHAFEPGMPPHASQAETFRISMKKDGGLTVYEGEWYHYSFHCYRNKLQIDCKTYTMLATTSESRR